MNVVNKHGQAIGRKGTESRQRLMDAARMLIESEPAHKLTASSIARAANMASQTFYLYFDDIDEILLALSNDASSDMAEIHEALRIPLTDAAPAVLAKRFIDAFSTYWDRHRPILSVRNYLADNGNQAFLDARQDSAMPLIQGLAARIMAAHLDEELTEREAFARSVIIFSAIERMAARPASIAHRPTMVTVDDLQRAEIDILTLLFTPTVRVGDDR